MSNQWFRMYHEFATDPKVQMLSETDQRRYIMLLCLKCSNGDVTLHETEVAFQLRISNEELTATKERLIQKGLINEAFEPTAWDKRQFKSDSSAERVAKYRNKKKQECNVTETKSNALDTDTDTDTDTDNKKTKEKKPRSQFIKPTELETASYAKQNNLDLTGFFDYYQANGWKVGRNTMKDWQAAARNWNKRQNEFGGKNAAHKQTYRQDKQSSYLEELARTTTA